MSKAKEKTEQGTIGNPNCDGSGPHMPGQVRVLPLSSNPDNGNLILCLLCFEHEIQFRRERNKELAPSCRFDLPDWKTLKVYRP